jgi:hypothetical protein
VVIYDDFEAEKIKKVVLKNTGVWVGWLNVVVEKSLDGFDGIISTASVVLVTVVPLVRKLNTVDTIR